MARVFVTRQLPGSALDRLAESHQVEVWPERLPPSHNELISKAGGADALITMLSDRIDAQLINASPNLKVVANYAVGYDNIDLDSAAAHNVAVANTPDVLTEATADLAWALLMAAARKLPAALENAHTDWQTWEPRGFLGADVHNKTLLIIGGGRIGTAMARRAQGFDMPVITVGRDHSQLSQALAQADFISLHAPLTPETKHLINTETLEHVRDGAILINTARGGLVDQRALAAALNEGRLAAAALDVTDPEPLPASDPLWQAPNLLIAPHIGSATESTRARMADMTVDNVLAGLAGEPLPNAVQAR
ncbi:MAG: D-glycerate dehydrogenase [Solirubrobacterales bacterium]|nr:D-glycerate dehydrogenase [Solirubrobacterales bacterium]